MGSRNSKCNGYRTEIHKYGNCTWEQSDQEQPLLVDLQGNSSTKGFFLGKSGQSGGLKELAAIGSHKHEKVCVYTLSFCI